MRQNYYFSLPGSVIKRSLGCARANILDKCQSFHSRIYLCARTHQQFPRQHISLIPHLQISHPLISINLLWERSTKYIRLKTKCGSLSSFLSFVMCNFFPFECVARDNHSFSRCSSTGGVLWRPWHPRV